MKNADFDILLFDLGGVLVELTGVPKMLAWMNHRVDERELWRMWTWSPAVRDYERGLIGSPEFAEAIIAEFGLAVAPEQFLSEYAFFPRGLYPGARELLGSLAAEYRLACFSNTNDLHWTRLCREERLDVLFHQHFLSFQIGLMKPDPEAYAHVVTGLGCAPGRVVFFDDNPYNVAAGTAAGLLCYQVEGFGGLARRLKQLDIGWTQERFG